ncbi:hypothetical protein ACMFMF_005261 [Clarireedia jacksonii]
MLCQMCDRLNVEDLIELQRTNMSNDRHFGNDGCVYLDNPQYALNIRLVERNGMLYMAICTEDQAKPIGNDVETIFWFIGLGEYDVWHHASRNDLKEWMIPKKLLGLCLIKNQNGDADGNAGEDGNTDAESPYRRVGYVQIPIINAEQWVEIMR